jgi:hypothetical protein
MLIEGPAAGEVCTFIGRSYSGKSLVATQIMTNNPTKGCIFFSLEMPYRQALMRLHSQFNNIDADQVRTMVKTNKLDESLDDLAAVLNRQIIVDQSNLNTGDMTSYIERYEEFYESKPDFILIDYLERIAGLKSNEGGWQGVEAQADMVKDLAKGMDIPVFLFHQTNRTEPAHTPPTDKSARGGGFTEADFMVGMWQPATDPDLTPFERQAMWPIIRMNVLKNRHSGQQNMPWRPLEFERTESLRFIDIGAKEQQKETFEQHQAQVEEEARRLGEVEVQPELVAEEVKVF